MSLWTQPAILLAEGRWRNLGRGVQGRSSGFDLNTILVIGLVVVVLGILIGTLARYVNGRDSRQHFNKPKALFRSLCRAHKLDSPSCRILQQIASHQRLTQPARLFLEPDRFEPANLSASLMAQATRIASLKEKLFATSAPEFSHRSSAIGDPHKKTPGDG